MDVACASRSTRFRAYFQLSVKILNIGPTVPGVGTFPWEIFFQIWIISNNFRDICEKPNPLFFTQLFMTIAILWAALAFSQKLSTCHSESNDTSIIIFGEYEKMLTKKHLLTRLLGLRSVLIPNAIQKSTPKTSVYQKTLERTSE